MRLLVLHHSNLRVPVYVVAERIDGFYDSEAHKCRHVLTSGSVLPVSESLDELKRLIGGKEASVINQMESSKDGIQTSK